MFYHSLLDGTAYNDMPYMPESINTITLKNTLTPKKTNKDRHQTLNNILLSISFAIFRWDKKGKMKITSKSTTQTKITAPGIFSAVDSLPWESKIKNPT